MAIPGKRWERAKRQSGRMKSSNCPSLYTRSLEGCDTAACQPVLAVAASESSLFQCGRRAPFVRRAMLAFTMGVLSITAADAQLVIGDSPGLSVPSFRDTLSPFDGNNTTWFGWGLGSFDGANDNEIVDLSVASVGAGGLDGTLFQSDWQKPGVPGSEGGPVDIVAGSNNIYTLFSTPTLELTVPTNGTVGLDGFTTIILQGRAASGGFGAFPVFSAIGGIVPTVVFGTNAAQQGQFWVKYELPGNAASYDIDITFGNHTSIGEISVDTQWSTASYAPDTAVPEPTSAMLVLAGIVPLALRRRRKSEQVVA